MWPGPEYTDDYVLNTLHQYPNLILWMAGHRHVNVVTPQPDPGGRSHARASGRWKRARCATIPQQFRTFDIRRNTDNTVSIIITNVDPAVQGDSPAYKSRGYAIGAARVYGTYSLNDTTSHSYNAELVVQLTPVMQSVISQAGMPLSGAVRGRLWSARLSVPLSGWDAWDQVVSPHGKLQPRRVRHTFIVSNVWD